MPTPAAEPFHAFAGQSGAGLHGRPFQRMGALKSVAGALATTGALVPPALAARMVSKRSAGAMPMIWHRWMTRSLGVTAHIEGEAVSGSVLYVCNHLSWLDIPVLGSRIKGSFVAKAEVGDMGFVTFLADFQRTIYVERGHRAGARAQADDISTRLASGDNVILFPEGTSNDGVRILPFKSSLFSVVESGDSDAIRIQPVTLAYTCLLYTSPSPRDRG
jgi:1-acyl-sn-glycerol-3-phosphate acyltransferase